MSFTYLNHNKQQTAFVENGFLFINSKIVNIKNLQELLTHKLDDKTYVVEGKTNSTITKYAINQDSIKPYFVEVPDNLEIEVFNNIDEANSFLKKLYEQFKNIKNISK